MLALATACSEPAAQTGGTRGMSVLGGVVSVADPARGSAAAMSARDASAGPQAGAAAAVGAESAASAPPAASPRPTSLYDEASSQLRAPEPGAGVQLETAAFDLEPGKEVFACYHAEIPVDAEIGVRYYESK